MRGDLREGDRLERQGRQGDGVERAVLEIRLEQAVEREQRRQHRADPQHAARDAREQGKVRADAERHQRRHGRKETPAPASRCLPRARRGGCREEGARSCEHPVARSRCPAVPCVAMTAMPPPAQCAEMRPAAIVLPAASSEASGSSISHNGRPAELQPRQPRRASSARRRDTVPADRRGARGPTASKRSADVAAGTIEPRKERQRLAHIHLRLDRVMMPEPARELPPLFAVRDLAAIRPQTDRTFGRRQEPGKHAQQRRLPRPIRALDAKRPALPDAEAQPTKQPPPTAEAGEVGNVNGFQVGMHNPARSPRCHGPRMRATQVTIAESLK